MRATFAYTAARILLFVVVLAVLYLARIRGPLLLGIAILASGLISFVVLSRQRNAMSGAIKSRIGNFGQRLDEGTRSEDED